MISLYLKKYIFSSFFHKFLYSPHIKENICLSYCMWWKLNNSIHFIYIVMPIHNIWSDSIIIIVLFIEILAILEKYK